VKRLRHVVVLGALTVVVGLLAVLAVADPFHLRHARWFTAGLVLLGILLLTAALAVAVGRGILRVLVLIVGGVAVLGWCALIGVANRLTSPSTELSQVADGGRRLVVLEGSAVAIDPVFAVVLRAGGGPFEQEAVVYQGVEAAPAPDDVRFVDADTVEVRVRGGCVYRSEVEAVTLAVDPVHRPLRADGC
jgi:hypothetical protein